MSDFSERPTIPFIEGDGTGPDIWRASQAVFDAAVKSAYGGDRQIVWKEILAGEKAHKQTGEWLPDATLEAIRQYGIAIKGPLTTPVGGGFRSLNVTMRQVLDLYACIRPLRWFEGTPSPVRHPERVNMVIFRENTEDVYAGIEWPEGSDEARQVIEFLRDKMGVTVRPDSGIGVKPISVSGSKRLIRKAIEYALAHKRPSVTMMQKGNIMKYTEGAFARWGYDLAREEFGDRTVSEEEVYAKYGGTVPDGKLLLKDRIADNMFQQVLTRPEEYGVVAAPNLNGDYISDALAAQVGGIGMSPGANVGDECAVFEATHGTAPKYAGLDKVNPCSVILSGAMMFEHMGWDEAAERVVAGVEATIRDGIVTYDLARAVQGAREVKTSEFGAAVIERLG